MGNFADSLPNRCGCSRSEPGNEVASRLRGVVRCTVRGDRRAASAQLAPLVGVTCVTHPIVKIPAHERGGWPVGSGGLARSPSQRTIATAYLRDSFTCRYCGRRTVPTQILRLISVAFPVDFPFHPNWRRDIAPHAYWDISTSVDHVHAVSTGGRLPGPGKPRNGMRQMPVPEIQLAARCARMEASCADQGRRRGWHDERVPGVVEGDRATRRAPSPELAPRIFYRAARSASGRALLSGTRDVTLQVANA